MSAVERLGERFRSGLTAGPNLASLFSTADADSETDCIFCRACAQRRIIAAWICDGRDQWLALRELPGTSLFLWVCGCGTSRGMGGSETESAHRRSAEPCGLLAALDRVPPDHLQRMHTGWPVHFIRLLFE